MQKLTVAIVAGLLGCASTIGVGCSKQAAEPAKNEMASATHETGKPAPVPPLGETAAAPPATPPPPAEPAPEAAIADPKKSISGQIVLAGALAKKKPAGTLYLIARRPSDNPAARGSLVAVKRFPVATYPMAFSLTAADMPFKNGEFEGEMVLSARIDQDGDPLSRQKGDVFGGLPKVQVGSQNVKLSLDQVQKEDESLAGSGGPMGGPMGKPTGGKPPGHP